MGSRAQTSFDVAILGGGPLACAIARDATGRGLRVLMCAPEDFGGDVKQHILAGGLHAANQSGMATAEESRIMQRICPQINLHNLPVAPQNGFLKRLFSKQQHSSPPCIVSPANAHRFSILNARDAAERGAVMLPNTPVSSYEVKDDLWHIAVITGKHTERHTSRILIDTLANPTINDRQARVALFERSTNIAPSCTQTPEYLSFCIEFCDQTAAVGLVSEQPPLESQLQDLAVTAGVAKPVWVSESFSPQIHDRDLSITGTPPLFSVSGTHTFSWRALAESIVAEMAPYARMIGKPWTAFSALPGGDFQPTIGAELLENLCQTHRDVPKTTVERLFKSYGTDCEKKFCTAESRPIKTLAKAC